MYSSFFNPKPTNHDINFEITSPSNTEEYELTIFNSSLQPVKSNFIRGIKTRINLEGQSLSSGTYFYTLHNKTKVFQTGKFILLN